MRSRVFIASPDDTCFFSRLFIVSHSAREITHPECHRHDSAVGRAYSECTDQPAAVPVDVSKSSTADKGNKCHRGPLGDRRTTSGRGYSHSVGHRLQAL